MSWILGTYGLSVSPDDRKAAEVLSDAPLARKHGERHDLACGGLEETCHIGTWHCPRCGEGNWFAVGVGLRLAGDACEILTAAHWQKLLATPSVEVAPLDGHFVVVRWCRCRLEAWTDVLGVRALYYHQQQGKLTISTRLDWLARLTANASLNMAAFGAHWLAFNQLSTTSLVAGIQRLGAGGHLTWDGERLAVAERPWQPEMEDRATPAAYLDVLSAFMHPQLPAGHALSLGLSGGIDSRLLLSLGHDALRLHSFGASGHPDVRLAQKLARAARLPHRLVHEPVPDAETCLRLTASHVAQTQAVSAASAAMGLRYYAPMHRDGLVIVDGGFGEVARRQAMNRLLRKNKNALLRDDAAAMAPHLRFARADVFSADALHAMHHGLLDEIEALLASLPPADWVGAENWVDLLGVRARLPNFFGYEQNRLDGLCRAYMPFAQPSVLSRAFGLPLTWRRGGKLFHTAIRQQAPALARYPLVKSSTTYPFRFGPVGAYVWTKIAGRLQTPYQDPTRHRFLETVLPHLHDLAQDAIEQSDLYDADKLTRLIQRYAAGHQEKAGALDWWLAFELWRRSLRSKDVLI